MESYRPFLNSAHDGPLNGPFGHIPAPSEDYRRFSGFPNRDSYNLPVNYRYPLNYPNVYGGYPGISGYRGGFYPPSYGSYGYGYGTQFSYDSTDPYENQPGMLKGAFDGAVKGVIAGAFGL
uniref:Uncharacterized protein n=1 Tax=Panagrolaimus sp. JU765 TaxID=591449 RepID=A0AC34Q555_9BILA